MNDIILFDDEMPVEEPTEVTVYNYAYTLDGKEVMWSTLEDPTSTSFLNRKQELLDAGATDFKEVSEDYEIAKSKVEQALEVQQVYTQLIEREDAAAAAALLRGLDDNAAAIEASANAHRFTMKSLIDSIIDGTSEAPARAAMATTFAVGDTPSLDEFPYDWCEYCGIPMNAPEVIQGTTVRRCSVCGYTHVGI